jgi:hypothetical protein
LQHCTRSSPLFHYLEALYYFFSKPYIKLSGVVTEEDILSAFDDTVSFKNYKNGMGRLWDLRDTDLSSLSPASIERFTSYHSKFPTEINDVKVALVATKQIEFGIAQIYELYASDLLTNTNVFTDIEKTEAWMMQ